MTYKKACPIGASNVRFRKVQAHKTREDLTSVQLELMWTLSSSTELHRIKCTQDTSVTPSPPPSRDFGEAPITQCPQMTTLFDSTSVPQEDDDYDNCEEYDADYSGTSFDESWQVSIPVSGRPFDEEDYDLDSDDSASEFGSELAASTSISLSASIDVLSDEAKLCSLPHWWGEEDSEHVEMVLHHYMVTVGVEEEQKKSIRSAIPFVGHVLRHQVPSLNSLLSIDEVSVFRYEMVPFGQTMPLIRRHYVLTSWDTDSGLPISQHLISQPCALAMWLPKARHSNMTALVCEPDAASPSHFIFTAQYQQDEQNHISIGYHNSSLLSWSRFFPESAFHGNLSLDD